MSSTVPDRNENIASMVHSDMPPSSKMAEAVSSLDLLRRLDREDPRFTKTKPSDDRDCAIQRSEISSTGLNDCAVKKLSVVWEARLVEGLNAEALTRQRQHLVRHVQPVDLSGGTDSAHREQHVDTTAGAQVEYRLARFQLG